MVAIDEFLEKLSPLNDKSVFRTFSLFAYRDYFLFYVPLKIFHTLLCHTKIQIKFEFGFDPLIFPEVMALGLRLID
jgi:hypothetical protein